MTDQVNEAVSTPSEAVYAFGALLTTLSGSLTIGATHDASVMAQMCEAFRVANSWEPPRDNYTDYLARTSLDHLLPEAAPQRGAWWMRSIGVRCTAFRRPCATWTTTTN